jgi:hypothetical protein
MDLGYDLKYDGVDPQYPPPPRVHWLVLLVAWWAASFLIALSVPERYRALANSILVDAWAFYLCHWIGRLDPEARSPFWCDVSVVVELGCAGLSSIHHSSDLMNLCIGLLGIASGILGIVTIFLIRSDLEKHYNSREQAGLSLSGVMTFFFSFLYFQYHLYGIANRKKLQAESLSARQLS